MRPRLVQPGSPGLGRVICSFYHATIRPVPALYAGIYQVFFRDGAEPRPAGTPLAALAADGLLALTARYAPTSSCRSSTWPPRSPAGSASAVPSRCPVPWW